MSRESNNKNYFKIRKTQWIIGILVFIAINVIMIIMLFILDVLEDKFGVLLPMIIAFTIIISVLSIPIILTRSNKLRQTAASRELDESKGPAQEQNK